MSKYSKTLEQGGRIGQLVDCQEKAIIELAEKNNWFDIRYIFLAARTTFDNAGRFPNYWVGTGKGLRFALTKPSLFASRHTSQAKNSLNIGISQSGQSSDIVSVKDSLR